MRAVDLTRRRFLGTASAAAIASQLPVIPAGAQPASLRGGKGGVGASVGEVTTFVVQNHESAQSLGFKRIGLPFKPGDVPAGSRIKIQRGGTDIAAQFDNRSTYPDKSLRFCTACIRDTPFAANESRTYSVRVESGAFDNSSAASLANVTGVSDFRVEFTSLSGVVSGALPDHAAMFNNHAAVPTRVTRYESGPVCDSWTVWGMAANGTTPHAHLKTVWYLSRWKNANGTQAGLEVAAVVALDWWAVPGKEKLSYAATLKNGASTIETYGGSISKEGVRSPTIEHPYESQWVTVRLQNDAQHGTRHWIGVARPTLLYKPDRSYWIATGLVPPLNINKNFTMPLAYINGPGWGVYQPMVYQPCSAQSHRPGEQVAGGYPGRGPLPNMDCIAFVTQTAQNICVLRVNALVGLHFPCHRRSSKLRTRPGETADVANTICSLIMYDERGTAVGDTSVSTRVVPNASRGAGTPPSFYDFTADGMPPPAHAYCTTLSVSYGTTDGWTKPAGTQTSGTSNWSAAGGYGAAWAASHGVAHSWLGYLWEGERYLLEAILGEGITTVQYKHGFGTGGLPHLSNSSTYPGMSPVQWAAIGVNPVNVTRILAWTAMLLSHMTIIPDNDVQANYVKRLVGLNAKYTKHVAEGIPASGNGAYYAGRSGMSPWMDAFIPITCYGAGDISGDPNWYPIAEFCAKGPISWAELDRVGHSSCYHSMARPKHDTVWSPSNDWFPDGMYELVNASIDAATNRIIIKATRPWPFLPGDEVVVHDLNNNFQAAAPPPELAFGVTYYMVNPTGSTSFQLSATPGGPPIVFADSHTMKGLGIRLQSTNDLSKKGAAAGADSYGPISRAAVVMARRHNHPLASQTVMDRYDIYFADVNASQWATWSLSEAV